MHTAEEVRKEAEDFLPWAQAKEMLLAYADLLEAMEQLSTENGYETFAPAFVDELRQRAAEKARKV